MARKGFWQPAAKPMKEHGCLPSITDEAKMMRSIDARRRSYEDREYACAYVRQRCCA